MATKKLIIDPKLFTQGQWEEACATVDMKMTDYHREAKPVKFTKAQVVDMAADCRSKAQRVADGELGGNDEGDSVNIEQWADDLISVAEIFERIAGVIPPNRKTRIALDENELATVLAALRMFQERYDGFSDEGIRDEWPEHFVDNDGVCIEPLGSEDIDTLCERINV